MARKINEMHPDVAEAQKKNQNLSDVGKDCKGGDSGSWRYVECRQCDWEMQADIDDIA